MKLENSSIAIIGLGYVGLPLAVAFGRTYPTTGFDVSKARIDELEAGRDSTLEVEPDEMAQADKLSFTLDPAALRDCNVFIVTVPTPIDEAKTPDLRPLAAASKTVGNAMKRGAVVIYESTVYPGATEEYCVPILEAESGMKLNEDFYAGYSPERINPGDKSRRVTDIIKVTSGSNADAAQFVDALYRSIIPAGTHLTSSIRVAEAAKVIENTQRDVNIALVNEFARLFARLGIDTLEVLEAAGTKWNFLPFRPGLVGGHCISVDPYYLTHKAQQAGHHPEIILAGRRLNDGMGNYVAEQIVKLMTRANIPVVGANVLVLGLTFKENCPDLRNTRVVDVINEFESFHANVSVHDPWVNADEAQREYGIHMVEAPQKNHYDAVVVAVGHRQFIALGADGIRGFLKDRSVLYDIKGVLPKEHVDGRL